MEQRRRVGVVTDDLMWRSQLQQQLAGAGADAVVVRGTADIDGISDLVVDLNAAADERIALIAAGRAALGPRPIIGFCRHDDRETRRRAIAAGASRVVANGGIASVCGRLLRGGTTDTGDGLEVEGDAGS